MWTVLNLGNQTNPAAIDHRFPASRHFIILIEPQADILI